MGRLISRPPFSKHVVRSLGINMPNNKRSVKMGANRESENTEYQGTTETERESEKGIASDREEPKATRASNLRPGEKKFSARNRLFIGNLTSEVTEDDVKKMFEEYGEVFEVFLNRSKGFGFVRMDSRTNAESAKLVMDGMMKKNRIVRVRFATHNAGLRVRNLSSTVSNELLGQAFSQFGEVERSVVVVDDRGRPTGEGIVEFNRKSAAQTAINKCTEGCFLITSSPRPVLVQPLEQTDEEDGQPEKSMQKNISYHQAREMPPRFAKQGSFEFDWAARWKSLDQMEKEERDKLDRQFKETREKMEIEMENAVHEKQANQMRQELVQRQEELWRLEETNNRRRSGGGSMGGQHRDSGHWQGGAGGGGMIQPLSQHHHQPEAAMMNQGGYMQGSYGASPMGGGQGYMDRDRYGQASSQMGGSGSMGSGGARPMRGLMGAGGLDTSPHALSSGHGGSGMGSGGMNLGMGIMDGPPPQAFGMGGGMPGSGMMGSGMGGGTSMHMGGGGNGDNMRKQQRSSNFRQNKKHRLY